MLTVNECNLHRVAAVGVNDDFADVYDRPLGTLEGDVHLRVDSSVVSVVRKKDSNSSTYTTAQRT